MNNQMETSFPAIAENEAFARMVISAFLVPRNPPMSVVSEVRMAVSEAVTNAIVHAYSGREGSVKLRGTLEKERLIVEVEDSGCGIGDIPLAMTPFYTSQPELERTGMGFSMMQSFMDGVHVESAPGCGTVVRMVKYLSSADADIA